MNWKRYATTVLVVFLAANVTGFLIHALILQSDYAAVPNATQVYRAQADTKLPLIWIAYLGYALGSVWLFAKGVEARPWLGQGLRFGAAVWLVMDITYYLITYAIQPMPETLLAKQLGLELVDKLLLGALTAALYRLPASSHLRTRVTAA